MKKIILLGVILLVLNIIIADSNTIYDFLKDIEDKPNEYRLVISDKFTTEETKTINHIAQSFGIKRSSLDTSAKEKSNLIIIGSSEINSITKKLIGHWKYKKGDILIKLIDNNLIIAGTTPKDNIEALGLMIEYQKNRKKLKTQEYSPKNGNLLSNRRSNMFIWLTIGIVMIILAIILAKTKGKKQEYDESRENTDLQDYVLKTLKMGYNKEQILYTLLQHGWQKEQIDGVFNALRL